VLAQCTADNRCLGHRPRVVVGGNGISGQAFVDNKAFREYTARVFDAQVLDMESAAVAHVAYANGTPFIAFRSLSDLAGGGDGENEMTTFLQLASENSAAVVRAFLKGIQ
jgi:adenosylhomocysteine nucleosidase